MATKSGGEFRSPKRALARSFRLSRDRWKEKAGQRRDEIRALKVRLRDLEVSRDLWKQKSSHLQLQVDRLRASGGELVPSGIAEVPVAPAPLVTAPLVEVPMDLPARIAQPPLPPSAEPAEHQAPGKKKRESKRRASS